jgi:hypothetical protein
MVPRPWNGRRREQAMNASLIAELLVEQVMAMAPPKAQTLLRSLKGLSVTKTMPALGASW